MKFSNVTIRNSNSHSRIHRPFFSLLILFLFILSSCRGKKDEVTYTDSLGNSIRLHIVQKGEGRPILFLHGNSFNHEVWKKQFDSDKLKNYRLIAYDLRGHGRSVKFNDRERAHLQYSLSLHAEDLREVIKQLGLKDAVVVGWSLGGNVLLRYLADNPTPPIAKGIILGAAPSNGFGKEPDFSDYPVGPPSQEMGWLMKNFFLNPNLSNDAAQRFVKMALGTDPSDFLNPESGLSEEDILHFSKIVQETDGFSRTGFTHGLGTLMEDLADGKLDIPTTDERVRNLWQMELLGDISRMRTPVKLLISRNDLIPIEQIRYMKKLNPDRFGESTIHAGGHAIFYSQPEIFENELVSYLEK